MGDKVSIPRSFADIIGVADTLPSVRRKYITLFSGALTTAHVWPGGVCAAANGRGLSFFARPFTVERAFLALRSGTTRNGTTTAHRVHVMAGNTTVVSLGRTDQWSRTTAVVVRSMSTTPTNPNIAASSPIRVVVVGKVNRGKQGTIVLVGREALDS